MSTVLKPPFVYFGGKRRVAPIVWAALGVNVPNYIEPFCGSAAVLLARPNGPGKIETINDIDCEVANFWRATIADPQAVAAAADWPVNEADLHARAIASRETLQGHREKMHADASYYDATRAGIWCWGMSTAIGGNWPHQKGDGASPRMAGWIVGNGSHALPSIGHSGRGVHSPEREALITWFGQLRDRLRRVRVACGDWSRVLTGAVTGASNSLKNMGMSPCGVFLDPPYGSDRATVYQEDSRSVAAQVCEWAIAHGDDPHFRIALCGYDGEHAMPAGWTEHAWKATGGHGNRNAANLNRHKERIWFSPHCLAIDSQRELFAETHA